HQILLQNKNIRRLLIMNSSLRLRCLSFVSVLVIMFIFTAANITAQSDYFGSWSPGTSPQEVGKRLAENWAARKFEYESGKRQYVIYSEICAWYGSLNVAESIKDNVLQNRL